MRIETKILDVEYDEEIDIAYFGDYLSLDAKNVVNSAKQNIANQADNDYFDGLVSFFIDGELFFDGDTTELSGLWLDLVCFRKLMNNGTVKIIFLDSVRDLFIMEIPDGYRLKYTKADHTFNDENRLTHSENITIESKPIGKEIFEKSIRKGFIKYRDFVVNNELPIASSQLEMLKRQKI